LRIELILASRAVRWSGVYTDVGDASAKNRKLQLGKSTNT